jgi:hypothetical protein
MPTPGGLASFQGKVFSSVNALDMNVFLSIKESKILGLIPLSMKESLRLDESKTTAYGNLSAEIGFQHSYYYCYPRHLVSNRFPTVDGSGAIC